MDRLLSMRTFRQVATEGSFAAAARVLDMSPAVVTRLVVDLEEHLGTRLIQRTTRRMVLTEAGRLYLERVEHILDAIDEADALASAETDAVQGMLRLHAPPVLAVHILAPLMAGFHRLHPQVVLDVDVGSPDNVQVDQYDITLLGTRSDFNGNVVARPVVNSFGILVAAPGYLQRMGTPAQPEDLARHAGLCHRMTASRQASWLLSRQNEPGDVAIEWPIAPVLWSNHTDTLLRVALDGAGIAALPVELAAPYLFSQALVRVLPDWISGRFTVFAALPSRRHIPRRTQVFLDYLTTETRLNMERALSVHRLA